ncbi:MAG: hypothetical protein EOO53_07030 [Gammaproteobacteria bacterium]|nr:MAG: hypothetical protein EOO53_07030 [Gammaproteobacteria bacterium]
MENKQDVCFSDDATGMSHRNDSNFLKRAGTGDERGRFSLVTFFGEAKKVTRQQAKKYSKD